MTHKEQIEKQAHACGLTVTFPDRTSRGKLYLFKVPGTDLKFLAKGITEARMLMDGVILGDAAARHRAAKEDDNKKRKGKH